MAHVKVVVTLKPSLLDAQGRVVQDALHAMGFAGVEQVRIGKHLELDLTATSADAIDAQVREMCDRLLANPVIEDYRYEVSE